MPKLLLFSDLHVNSGSEHTCFEVLNAVLEHAHRLDATVCFLGDWWDHVYRNGTLQTDMQNRFIRFFSEKWDVPTLMIPGNHDYCDASEKEHGMTAFKYASSHLTIFEVPTVHDNVLWIPWRRKHDDLITALNTGGEIKCIFGHFDIVGALLNNTKVSEEGLRPAEFPPNIPIYSGHYHKPQQHEQVVFVGSPYQTTQAECGQQKRLVVIDTDDYASFTAIPINFGPSRYKVTKVEDIPDTIAQRDIVTVKLGSGEPVPDKIVDLRRKGVIVKIKRVAETRPVRFEMKPDTRPEELLDAYAKGREDPEVIAFIKGELKKIQTERQTEIFGAVEWHEISGVIGPFTKPFRIDLNGRGLVLVTGQRDEERSRSNGSGKSFCTCTAMLWVLTGITDTRSGGDSSKDQKRPAIASVVNEKVGRAQIVLKGKIGDKTIEIDRKYIFSKKTAGKGYQKLVVKANGQNITRATLDATQNMLCQIMGVPSGGAKRPSHALHAWLIRTALWTQSAPTSWLKMSDKYIKDELAWLSAVDMWDKILEVVKAEVLKSKDMFLRIDGSIKHAKLDIATFKAQLERMRRSNEVFEEKKAAKISGLQQQIDKLPTIEFQEETFQDPPQPNIQRPDLNSSSRYKLKNEDLWKCKADLQTAKNIYHSVPHPIVVPKIEYVNLEEFKKKVNALQARAVPPETECKACGRPFMGEQEKMKAEERYKNIVKRLRRAEKELLAAAQKEGEMKLKTKEAETAQQAIKAGREIEKLEPYILQLQAEIAETQKQHEHAVAAYEDVFHKYSEEKMAVQRKRHEQARKKDEYQKNVAERARLEKELAAAHRERSPFFLEIQQNEIRIQKAEKQLAEFCERTADLRKKGEMLRRAKNWVGSKGVRTYVMDNTLRMLEKSMVKWASIMFPDEDIHVRLDHREDGTIERIVQVSNINTTLSGGQFRRMEIASWFSWREAAINRSGITQNVVYMDEPTHSLDLKGVECLTDGLKQFCREMHNRSIMFITHENTQFRDTSAYDNMLHVVRKGHASHLRKQNMKRKCCGAH